MRIALNLLYLVTTALMRTFGSKEEFITFQNCKETPKTDEITLGSILDGLLCLIVFFPSIAFASLCSIKIK